MGPCFQVPTSIWVIPSSLCDNSFESNPDLTSADQSVRYRNFVEYHSTVYICLVPELNYYTVTVHAMDNESARSWFTMHWSRIQIEHEIISAKHWSKELQFWTKWSILDRMLHAAGRFEIMPPLRAVESCVLTILMMAQETMKETERV